MFQINTTRATEGKEKEGRLDKTLEVIIAYNSPNLEKKNTLTDFKELRITQLKKPKEIHTKTHNS